MRWGERRRRLPALVTTVILGVLLGTSGCHGGGSHDGGGNSSPGSGSSSATEKPEIKTVTSLEKVSGHLNQGHQDRMTTGVGTVIDTFFDGAYLGDFPRSDYSGAFADFTKGAQADALQQLDTMSNQPISGEIDQASATNRRVRLDVFAPKGRPRGVTANFVLDFTTSGSVTENLRVHGALYLTKSLGKWHVFGYDVDQAVKL
jgi:hypothetical protein